MRNLWDNRITKGKGWITIPKKLKSSGIKALVENAIWTQGLRTKLPPAREDMNSKQIMDSENFSKHMQSKL